MLARLGLNAATVPLTDNSVGEAAAAVLAAAPARFVAVGFSLGGFVVLEVLRRAPERLHGAVLIASHAEPDTPAAAAERARQARLFEVAGSAALIADLWPRYVAPRASDGVRATVDAMAADFSLADYAAQSAIAASRPDGRADGPTRVPLLVVGGAADALCPPARGRATAARLGGNFVEIPDAGHFVPLEAPDALAAAVGDWLATVREAALCD